METLTQIGFQGMAATVSVRDSIVKQLGRFRI